jgi:hypothetical protein
MSGAQPLAEVVVVVVVMMTPWDQAHAGARFR